MKKRTKLLVTAFIPILGLIFLRASTNGNRARSLQAEAITGRVTDGALPISGARVRIQGDTAYVTTDKKGYFNLPVGNYPSNEVPVTAGKVDWLNAGLYASKGARDVILTLEHIPLKDDKNYRFVHPDPSLMGKMMAKSGMIGRMMQRMPGMMGRGMMGMRGMSNCGNCHFNIYKQWKSSSMARTSRNPRVLNLYNGTDAKGKKGVGSGYRLDFPTSSGPCADCHAPSAAVRNPGKTDLNTVLEKGGVDEKGVHCDFCHKIRQVKVNNHPGVNGSILLNRQRIGGDMMMRPIFVFGPYDDVVTMPMAASYSSLYRKSEYCSSCHQSAWPLVAGKTWEYTSVYPGKETYPLYEKGKVIPDYWTYQEWLEWQDSLPPGDPDKGRQCQDCHMNWTKEMLPYKRFIVTGIPKKMMGVEREPGTIHPHHFQGATEKRLQGAAYMSLDAHEEGSEIVVKVEITNVNTGHRLPTGFSMRNMILLITAMDSAGIRLQQVEGPKIPVWGGLGDPDQGNYAGMPGMGYAKVTEDGAGNRNVPIWRAERIALDNRIKPGETDIVSLRFKKPDGRGEIEVTARLLYRSVFKPIADRKKWDLKEIIMEEKSIVL